MNTLGATAWHRYFTLPWLAFGFALLLAIIYLPFAEAGFVVDYTGWKERVDAGGFWGALHTYDFPAHLQFYALMMWAIEQLRLIHPMLVQLVLCVLGGFATAAAVRFVATEAGRMSMATPEALGLCVGLLWVLSPGGTEAYILKVCPHYLVSALLWCLSLHHLGCFVDGGKRRDAWIVIGCQALGLVTLELSYALPLVLTVYLLWRWAVAPALSTRSACLVVGGTILLVALHPLATKLVYGSWIGHYGAEVATALPVGEVLAGPWRWLGRSLLQLRFWPFEVRRMLGDALARPGWLLLLYGASALATGFAGLQLRQGRPRVWHLSLLFLALAGLAAAPISQLYYYDLQLIENDRLGFLVSLFGYGFVVLLLTALGRRVLWPGIGVLALINVYFLLIPLHAWRVSHVTLVGLVESAKEHLAQGMPGDTILLIGYLNSVRGAQAFSDIDPKYTGFGSHVNVMYPEFAWPPFVEVAQFNQQDLSDSVNVEWGNDRIYVSLASDGAWWWHRQYGLGAYEDSAHAYRVEPQAYHFEITFTDAAQRQRTCWYQQGSNWKQVVLPPR